MKHLRIFLLLITVALCGCASHQRIQQNHIYTRHTIEEIHTGMNPAEVIAKLGSPSLKNRYGVNWMIFIYSDQPTRKLTTVKRLVIQFKNDRVVNVQHS